MKNRRERRYGWGHLHFITCSCYRRLPFFASERRRDIFLRILQDVRDRYDFALLGYVVMPGADDAYFKVCFQSNPACHNLIENCGKCGVWPPEMGDPHFHQ